MMPALAFLKALSCLGWQTPKQIPNKTAVGTRRRPNSSKQVEVDKPKGKPKAQSNGKAKWEAHRQAGRGVPRRKLYNTQSETQSRNDNEPKQSTPSDGSQIKNGAFKTKRTKQTEKVEARQKKQVLTKKEFGNIAATLRTISVTILVEFIQNFIKSERHLTVFHERTEIAECLRSSREFEPLLQRLFDNGLGILLLCFSNKPNDR